MIQHIWEILQMDHSHLLYHNLHTVSLLGLGYSHWLLKLRLAIVVTLNWLLGFILGSRVERKRNG